MGSELKLSLPHNASILIFSSAYVKLPHLEGGRGCGPCHDFASYILVFDLQLRKIRENLSQVSRKAPG